MKNELNKINEITSRYILPTIEERTSYGYKRLDPYTKFCLLYTSPSPRDRG